MWGVGAGGERIALKSLTWKKIAQLSFDNKKGIETELKALTWPKSRCFSYHRWCGWLDNVLVRTIRTSSQVPFGVLQIGPQTSHPNQRR